jgi:hypothetical protein
MRKHRQSFFHLTQARSEKREERKQSRGLSLVSHFSFLISHFSLLIRTWTRQHVYHQAPVWAAAAGCEDAG